MRLDVHPSSGAGRHRGGVPVTVTGVERTTPERPVWRTVALPSEHGGWGLTLEPVLLGLLVAHSLVAVALGVGALFAFLVRTPLKLAAVDARRGRWLARSKLAVQIAAGELLVVIAAVTTAVWIAGWSWMIPVAVAAPLVGIELWFDVRSRGRRLVPELCGAVAIGSVAAAIVVSSGGSARLAAGAGLVLTGLAIGSIPFVRVQLARLRQARVSTRQSDVAQLVAFLVGATAVVVDHRLVAGLAGLTALVALQVVWVRRPPVVAKVLGLRQMALGIGLVVVTAAGVLVS
jgi:hypothetical protein